MICKVCDYEGETAKLAIFGYCFGCFIENYEYVIDDKYAILFSTFLHSPAYFSITKTSAPVLATIDDIYNFQDSWDKLIFEKIPNSEEDETLIANAKELIPVLEKRCLAKKLK